MEGHTYGAGPASKIREYNIKKYTNTRTTFMCCENINKGFMTAFRGGQVLGFCLVGLALLVLELILLIFRAAWYTPALE